MNVREGEIVGLIGPNGSGKTTLMKHVYRVLPVQKRTVFINGTDIENYSYRETARQMTVMKQETKSDFDYGVMEMVLMGRAPYRSFFSVGSAEDKQIASESLKAVGMEEYSDRVFSTLSGGEKQRVLIARSLTQQADILLLDEPTNHLDVHYQWSLMDVIKGLNKTVLSVLHELNLAFSYCDYLFVLNNGRIMQSGTPAEICTKEHMVNYFRIDVDVTRKKDETPQIIYNRAL